MLLNLTSDERLYLLTLIREDARSMIESDVPMAQAGRELLTAIARPGVGPPTLLQIGPTSMQALAAKLLDPAGDPLGRKATSPAMLRLLEPSFFGERLPDHLKGIASAVRLHNLAAKVLTDKLGEDLTALVEYEGGGAVHAELGLRLQSTD